MTPWETWAGGVLAGVGAPVNAVNVDTLWAWSGAESLPRDRVSWCNPLNTTEPWPGAVPMNSVGVRRYLTIADGISATVMTLKNGHYPAIIANLRNSIPRKSWANACGNLGTWGTGCGWFANNYGPPPTNLLGGLHMDADVHAAFVALQNELTVSVSSPILQALAAQAKAQADATAAIVAAINGKTAAGGGTVDVSALTAQVAELAIEIGSMAATLAKIENALKAA